MGVTQAMQAMTWSQQIKWHMGANSFLGTTLQQDSCLRSKEQPSLRLEMGLVVLGSRPRTLSKPDKPSTTELHPTP